MFNNTFLGAYISDQLIFVWLKWFTHYFMLQIDFYCISAYIHIYENYTAHLLFILSEFKNFLPYQDLNGDPRANV